MKIQEKKNKILEEYLAKIGQFDLPGCHPGKKTEDRKEVWNMESVLALTSIDRFKFFEKTGNTHRNGNIIKCVHKVNDVECGY